MKFAPQRSLVPSSILPTLTTLSAWLALAASSVAGPFDAWSNSMKVTFNYAEYEPLTNFPVLVVLKPTLPGFSYNQFTSGSAADLRFADENGNEIPYEIEKWNPAGESLIWVQVPKLLGNRTAGNYVDGQWIGRWSWNGQDGFARRHTNNQLFAEKVVGAGDTSTSRQFCGGGEPITVFGAKPYIGKYFAVGDPRTGWTPPAPYGTYTDGQLLGTITDAYWMNRLGVNGQVYAKYDANLDCYYTVIGSSGPNAVFWGAAVSGGVLGTGAQFEQEAQHFVGFDPRSPNAPIGRDMTDPWYYDWSPNNYLQYVNWVGLNKHNKLTSITAYWGNAAATVAPAYTTSGVVWTNADFVGVWHMNQTAAQDSTHRLAAGTPTSVALATGQVGDAVNFNAAGSSKIDFGTVALGFSGNRGYTIEGWVKRNTDGNGPAVSYGGTSTGGSMTLGMDGSGNFKTIRHTISDRSFPRQARQGQWDYVAFGSYLHNDETTQDGFVDHVYVNGDWAAIGDAGNSTNKINLPATGALVFGKESWGSNTSGTLMLDEVRISKKVRSYNWQRCTYLTMSANSTFTTYGAVSNGAPPPTLWTAYNDIAWESGQLENGITPYGPVAGQATSGNLIDLSSGSPLGAMLSFTSSGTTPSLAGVVATAVPAAGSDADVAFTGKVDLQSRLTWSGGSVTLTVSGLSPTSRYSVVLYGARGNAAYTTRWTDVKISDNSGFANNSSAGSTILTGSVANDTTRIITGDNAAGRVFRFDDINPGSDGDVVFTFTGNGTETAYLNAVKVSTYPSGGGTSVVDSDGDGMSDAAEAKFGTNPSSPGSRVVVSTGFNGSSQRTLGWPTVNTQQYRVEYCDTIGAGWQTLTTITATSAAASFTDTTSPIPAKRFYRIVAL